MKLLIASLIILLCLSSAVFAQNLTFKNKVIITPDVAFLWNFQRGGEELYRFVKFSSSMRIDYSLELLERRIGEMEVLANESKISFIPMVESEYEIEMDKIVVEMKSTDIFTIYIKNLENLDIKENVTQRLQYDMKVLDFISKGVPESTKIYFDNAFKKTSDSVDIINKR